MAENSQSLNVSEGQSLGRRMRLARIAADLDPGDVAASLGISRRSYDRTEAGTRRPARPELIVFTELTGQELSFFGVTSEGPQEEPTLPGPLPGVNREDEDRAA